VMKIGVTEMGKILAFLRAQDTHVSIFHKPESGGTSSLDLKRGERGSIQVAVRKRDEEGGDRWVGLFVDKGEALLVHEFVVNSIRRSMGF